MYHYTTEEDLDGILESGEIWSSESQGEFPHGVYFTDLDPNNPKWEILRNNYGQSRVNQFQSNADYYIQFRTEELSDYLNWHEVNDSRGIWWYPFNIFLDDFRYFYHGKTVENEEVYFN